MTPLGVDGATASRDIRWTAKGDYRRKMWECLRATTAAPSYFTPLVDGDTLYADGAFMANNPTSIALTEVSGACPSETLCPDMIGRGVWGAGQSVKRAARLSAVGGRLHAPAGSRGSPGGGGGGGAW